MRAKPPYVRWEYRTKLGPRDAGKTTICQVGVGTGLNWDPGMRAKPPYVRWEYRTKLGPRDAGKTTICQVGLQD